MVVNAATHRGNLPPLYIFGTGIHARKVFHTISVAGGVCLGFVHSLSEVKALPFSDAPVLRHKELISMEPGFIFPAVGDPVLRRSIYEEYRFSGWSVPSVFHPSCAIAPDATVRDGVYVGAHSVIETMAYIGTGAIIDIGSIIDHEVEVAEYSHIKPGTILTASRGSMK